MLSITRSYLANLAQLSFLGLNAIGLVLGTIYSNKTPDLYANNSHSKIGWISACVAVIQTIMVLMSSFGDLDEEKRNPASISVGNLAQQNHSARFRDSPRYSQELGQCDDPVSSRDNSISGTTDCEEDFSHRMQDREDAEWDIDITEKRSLLGNTAVSRVLSRIPLKVSQKAMRLIVLARGLIDYTILLLGFLAITTGIVVYGGVFVSPFMDRLPQMARRN